MSRLRRPWLFLPSGLAHDVAPLGLRLYALGKSRAPMHWRSFSWRGLEFANPLGIAGGVDKNADALKSWWSTGMGFAEVGTVTPKPQGPNPGTIMARDIARELIWNKMGFPNKGAEALKLKLESLKPYPTPVFVNIGKNRETPLERAAEDYGACARFLSQQADVFVINISSPNTKDLRQLQSPEHLSALVEAVKTVSDEQPVLVKLSPDLTDDQLCHALDSGLSAGIDGFILTNTTSWRPEGCSFPQEGGLSGRALGARSQKVLELSVSHLGADLEKLLIVSVGGVMNQQDALTRLTIGANLVQAYSGIIFEGPGFFKNIMRS